MGKRGPKPQAIDIKWSQNFAYFIGVLASDGCMSQDLRHLNITSKDKEMVENVKKILKITNKIGKKASGSEKRKKYYVLQFGNVSLCQFLLGIGITPNKSKTIAKIQIPEAYFFDFLRGLFDGNGSIYSYFDRRWRSSFMIYISFASASEKFIIWLQKTIFNLSGLKGHKVGGVNVSWLQLRYAKNEALALIKRMYKNKPGFCLERKKLKIKRILATMLENKRRYKQTYS